MGVFRTSFNDLNMHLLNNKDLYKNGGDFGLLYSFRLKKLNIYNKYKYVITMGVVKAPFLNNNYENTSR